MKNNKKGFTLIEMLAVIAVVAILVTILVPILSGSSQKAACATNAANLRGIEGKIATMLITNPECFAEIAAKQENIDKDRTGTAALQAAVKTAEEARDQAQKEYDEFDPSKLTSADTWQKAVNAAKATYEKAESELDHSYSVPIFGTVTCPKPSSSNYENSDHSTVCKGVYATYKTALNAYNDAKSPDSKLYQAYQKEVNETYAELGEALKTAKAELEKAEKALADHQNDLNAAERALYHYISVDGVITLDDGTKITVPLSEKVKYKDVNCPKKSEMALHIDIENGIITSYYSDYSRQVFAKLAEEA